MRKLAIFAAGFTAACVLFVYVLGDARALLVAGACLMLSVLGKVFGLRQVSIACLGICAAMLWCCGYQLIFSRDASALVGTEQTVTVRVTDMPGDAKYGASVYGKLDKYPVVFYADEDALKLRPGDLVTCTAEIQKTTDKAADGESLFFRSRGARFLLFAKSELTVAHGKPTLPQQLRMWLHDRIMALYEGEEAGFLLAVLTGDRSQLSYRTENELSLAGLSHAIAVSGMHISMLVMLVSILCGKNPRLTAMFGIPVVIVFSLMTGASASVCRAAFMYVLMLLAPAFGRDHDGLTALGGAALLLLMIDPWTIADVSFQLSFSAVAGLILLSGPLQKKLLSGCKEPPRVLQKAVAVLSATLSATIATLPLILIYFRQISLVALGVNLLCLWAVTAIFTAGLISCFLGSAGAVLALPVSVLVKYIFALCRFVAAYPYAAVNEHNPVLMVWACCAYALVICLILCRRKLPVAWTMSLLTAAFLAGVLFGRWQLYREDMTFTAVDVGQGQCLVLQSEDFTAVIDCGGSYPDEAGEEAARLLHSAGVTQVDALVVTHYDDDHSGGVAQLLYRVEISQIFAPDYPSEGREILELAAKAAGVPVTMVTEQALVEFETGFMHLMAAEPGTEGNDASLCVLANVAEYDILVTGDRSAAGELALMSRWPIGDVDLLVAGHHGAANSTSKLLLEHVKPEKVLISAGENNRYGHPSAETLNRIADAGAEVLRTDELGTIILTD